MTFPLRKAVFPVAGLGTRFLPVTKAVPKEILPVLNKPLIQYAVEEAQAAGIKEILFVNGRGKQALEDYFDTAPEIERTLESSGKSELLTQLQGVVPPAGSYAFVRQTKPLGLGHAVLCAKAWVRDEPFAVLLPDDFILGGASDLREMMEAYSLDKGNMAAIVTVARSETKKYGILEIAEDAVLNEPSLIAAQSVVEKPAPEHAPSTHAIIGRYILHPHVFSYLEAQEQGVGGEIQLTDALKAMIPGFGLYGYQIKGKRFDCGSIEGMLAAHLAVGAQKPGFLTKVKGLLSAADIHI